MKKSRWIKYDAQCGLWIQSNKRIYLYWYSFLQHAERDNTRVVDWGKYEGWGNSVEVLNTKFDVWWRTHWKDLFGIPNEGDEPKFPLSTNRPKENGLRYALLVYEKRERENMWDIARDIAKEERRRKLGLTSRAFDYATPSSIREKIDAEERSYRKRYTQSKVGRYKRNAEEHLDNVCRGVFP